MAGARLLGIAGCVGVALNGAGQANCATMLAAGLHMITAQYGGDASFNAGSGTITQGVNYLLFLLSIQKRAP